MRELKNSLFQKRFVFSLLFRDAFFCFTTLEYSRSTFNNIIKTNNLRFGSQQPCPLKI